MKKISAALLMLVIVISMFQVTAFAAAQEETGVVDYYDRSGNLITVDDLYYNAQGLPCFNENCYYLDEEGNPVYVGGYRAYCYDVNPPAQSTPRYGRGGGCCGGGRRR